MEFNPLRYNALNKQACPVDEMEMTGQCLSTRGLLQAVHKMTLNPQPRQTPDPHPRQKTFPSAPGFSHICRSVTECQDVDLV